MAHIRLRKFNTKDAYPEQSLDNDLSMAVIAGNRIFLRGQTHQDILTVFYNSQRLHSYLNYRSPNDLEQRKRSRNSILARLLIKG